MKDGKWSNMFHSDKFKTNIDNPFEVIDVDNETLDGSLNLTNGCTRVPIKAAKYIYENCNTGLYTEVYKQKSFEDFDKDERTDAINIWSKQLEKAKNNEEIAKMEQEIRKVYGDDVWERVVAKTVWGKDTTAKIDKPLNTDVSKRTFAKKGITKSKKTKSK